MSTASSLSTLHAKGLVLYPHVEVTRIRYSVSSIPPDLSTVSDRTSLDVVPFVSSCVRVARSFVRQVVYGTVVFFGWHKLCQVVRRIVRV